MKVKIIITSQKVTLELVKDRQVFLRDSFLLDNHLGDTLLGRIEKIVKKVPGGFLAVRNFEVGSEVEDSYTSVRIAMTVANSLNWSLKKLKSAKKPAGK